MQIVSKETIYAVVAGFVSSLPMTARFGEPAPSSDRRPNIVFVLVDDLSWDELGCIGHPYVHSQHINQIVSSLDNEMRVERLISCSAKLYRRGQELLKLAYGRGPLLIAVAAELGRTEAATYKFHSKFHSRIRASLLACIERSLNKGR